MFRKSLLFLPVFVLLLTFASAFELHGVHSIGMGESNAALVLGGEALFINPAFLANQGFGFGKQYLDTNDQSFTEYTQDFFSYGSSAFGAVNYTDINSGDKYNINLAGFGFQMSKGVKWGAVVENINLNSGGTISNIWTTKVGVSYILPPPAKIFWGITLEHLFKETSSQTTIDVSPQFVFSVGLIPMEKILWTHSIDYKRKAGEKIHYATGIALLLDRNLVISGGINQHGYSAGIELPISFGKLSNLGKINYTVLMPYNISKEVKYYFSYSYGGK